MKKDIKDVEKDILKNVGKMLNYKIFFDIFNEYMFSMKESLYLNEPPIAKMEMIKYESGTHDVEHDFITYHIYCRNLRTNNVSDIAIVTNEYFAICGIFCKK